MRGLHASSPPEPASAEVEADAFEGRDPGGDGNYRVRPTHSSDKASVDGDGREPDVLIG